MEELIEKHKGLLKSSNSLDGSFADVANGEFGKVLSNYSPSWLKKFNYSQSGDSFFNYVTSNIDPINLSIDEYSNLILLSVASLHTFIQANATGPALTFDPYKNNPIGDDESLDSDKFNQSCIQELSSDGEPAFQLLSYGHLLLLSEGILSKLVNADDTNKLLPFSKWWYSRALVFHQGVLNEQSSSIFESIFTHFNAEETLNKIVSAKDQDLTTRFYCEFARAQLLYDQDKKAENSLEVAKTKSNLSFSLTGLKAKRTKYQQKETSQLVLLAKSSTTAENSSSSNQKPSAVKLDSDLLLEKPQYSNDDDESSTLPQELLDLDPNDQPILNDIDVAIILLNVSRIKQSSPHKEVLIQEQLLAMVERIISSTAAVDNNNTYNNWSLYSRALWLRSVFESDAAKTVQRGTLQMQSLVEELGFANTTTYLPKIDPKNEDEVSSQDITARLRFIHQLLPLPKWSMDSALAERFMSLGALKSALEVYERLEMWGEVALCYAAVGQEEKGIEVIQDHLERNPHDARGWAILGDITLNPEYWEKSWQVGKYASSKRSLGRYYYTPPKNSGVERDVEAAIRHLNDSLQINPLNESAWFLYGCAGLETAQWELAAEAFSRCVALDETDVKSWANLSTALIKLGKKSEAFKSLQQASKSAGELKDWRIWDNYVTVAADLNDWAEVVRGLKEMILIRADSEGERGVDLAILERVVQNLVETDLGEDAQSLTLFQRTAVDLITNTLPNYITNDARLYKLVARVNMWLRKPWAALESYEKGWRIISANLDVTDEKNWNQAVDYCTDLVDAYTNFGPMDGRIEGSVVCKDWKFKARTALRTLMGKGKAFWEDSEGWQRLATMKEEL